MPLYDTITQQTFFDAPLPFEGLFFILPLPPPQSHIGEL